jgi:hypothetical protein
MTKKDYEIIAEAIRDTREYLSWVYDEDNTRNMVSQLAIGNLKNKLIKAFIEENPKFDIEVFLTACGYDYFL